MCFFTYYASDYATKHIASKSAVPLQLVSWRVYSWEITLTNTTVVRIVSKPSATVVRNTAQGVNT